MDHEKKYKEALERAKRLRDSKYQTMNAKRVVEEIFPQLAESEDERIRKELIAILKKSYYVGGFTLNNKKDLDRYPTYLEKQKESLHIPETCKDNGDTFTDEDERIRRTLVEYFGPGVQLDFVRGVPIQKIRDWLEKQKEPENVSATTMAPSCWEVEQKEQKPLITGNDFGWIDELNHDLKHPEELDQKVDNVLKQRKGIRALEWSEEDERMLSRCIKSVECSKQFADSESYKVAKDVEMNWLKSLPERFNLPPKQEWSEEDEATLNWCISDIERAKHSASQTKPELCDIEINWLKSLKPRPKAEWSEEDEKRIQRIGDFLWKNRKGDTDTIYQIEKDANWLKSLRLDSYKNCNSRWKPSEEQMKAFSQIVQQFKPDKELESLYNDLNKLGVKEEPEYYQHFDPDC